MSFHRHFTVNYNAQSLKLDDSYKKAHCARKRGLDMWGMPALTSSIHCDPCVIAFAVWLTMIDQTSQTHTMTALSPFLLRYNGKE